jgi:hypothetical protein
MKGGWVSDEFIAFVVFLFLSIACVFGLIGGWGIGPEPSEQGTTDAGRRLHRARALFVAACGLIIACTGALYYCGSVGPYDSQPYQWFREHPFSAPLGSMISSGLSGASFFLALGAKGGGRRGLLIATSIITGLTLSATLLLFLSIRQ